MKSIWKWKTTNLLSSYAQCTWNWFLLCLRGFFNITRPSRVSGWQGKVIFTPWEASMFCYRCQVAARCALFLCVQSFLGICLRCFFIHIELFNLRLNICVKGLFPELLPFPDWVILNTSVSKLDHTSIKFLQIKRKSFQKLTKGLWWTDVQESGSG